MTVILDSIKTLTVSAPQMKKIVWNTIHSSAMIHNAEAAINIVIECKRASEDELLFAR